MSELNLKWMSCVLMACLVSAAMIGEASAEQTSEGTARVASQTVTLGVDHVVRVAIKRAHAVKVARAGKEHAEWQLFRADYAWLPKLTADTFLALVPDNADPNRFGDNVDEIFELNVGPFIRQSAQLVIPLYTFDRISSARGLARLGVENANLEITKERVSMAFDVKRAYYSLSLARTFDSLVEEGNQMLLKEIKAMQDARDFGDAEFKIKDLRKLQIFETEFQTRALDNEKLKTLSLAGLQYLTTTKISAEQVPALDADASLPILHPMSVYTDTAMQKRPEVQQLKRAVRARALQKNLAISAFYPNIYFAVNFSFGWSTEDVARQPICRIPSNSEECVFTDDLFARPYSDPYNQLGFGFALGLRWNLDVGQLYGKYKESQAKLTQVNHQQLQALGAIELELKKVYIEADHALKKVGIQAKRLKAAERWRNQLGLGAQQGGSVSDAIEPVRAYYEAKIRHLQAVYDYRIARAELAKAVGVVNLKDIEPSAKK